jgi:hypothetical protein
MTLSERMVETAARVYREAVDNLNGATDAQIAEAVIRRALAVAEAEGAGLFVVPAPKRGDDDLSAYLQGVEVGWNNHHPYAITAPDVPWGRAISMPYPHARRRDMSPEAYAEINPPFAIPPAWRHKLRPVAEWPHDDMHRMFALAWQEGDQWRGMWGHYDESIGGFRADAALHRTNALAGTPTHFVDDRG